MIEDGEEKKDGSYKVCEVDTAMKESDYEDDYLEENIRMKTDIVVDKTMKEKDMNDITTDKAMEIIYQDLVVGKTMEEKDMNDITTDKAIPDYIYFAIVSGLVAAAMGFASAAHAISPVSWVQTCQQRCKFMLPRRRLSRVSRHRNRRSLSHQCRERKVLLWAFLLLQQHQPPLVAAMQNGQADLQGVLTALTTATQVGVQTLARLEQSSSSSTHQESDITRRLESASKSLKNPDTWDGIDFASFTNWKHNFINWICFADSRFGDHLQMIEQLGNEAIDMSGATQADRELSGKLYSILTSYLRGSALQISRNYVKERCGFRLWQSLLWEFQPSTKQRSLTLSQAIAMYPGFDGVKPMVEQIGALENLVRDYELSAGKTYDRDLLMGVLLRCAPKTIREHLTVSLPSSANYGSVKQAILNYEKASKTWGYNTVLKQNALPSATTSGGAASSDQGPAPMEVDQVTSGKDHKGKGHKGGKGKGYWGTWSSYAAGKAFGRGYGRGKGHKGHGKSKGKKFGNKGGKKGSKGKGGKSGGKKGGKDKGGKAKLGRDVCRFCKQSGHWGNECPNRRNVREVSGSEVTTQAPSESVATLTIAPSQSASQYRVRRVGEMMRPSFYHMPVTPPSELEIHYVGSDEEDDQESLEGWYVRRIGVYCISMSHAEGSEEHAESPRRHYVIGEDDSDEEVQDWKSDPLYEWYVDVEQEDEPMAVRMVQALDARLRSVILDSGADVSLLPQGLAGFGPEVEPPRTLRIHDAQGGTMRVQGMRRAQLYFADSGCVIEEDFILSDSSHVLLSLRRLMRNGWKFQSQGTWGSWGPSGGNNNNGKAGGLISPDGKAVIPVEFHKNSLMVTAEVRSIQKVRAVMVKLLFSWERLGMCACSRLFGCSGACMLHISRL